MFENIPHVKKNAARMRMNHLQNVNSLDIIWFSYFVFNFEQVS